MIKFLNKNIFLLAAIFYSNMCFLLENLFLKKNITNQKKKLKNGYTLLKIDKPIKINKKSCKILKINKYFRKIIISENEVRLLIKNFFVKSCAAKKISKLTGFNYNISFFLVYNTYSIKDKDKNKLWHATAWHKDKPFSKNTLKIILPLKEIKHYDGGIQVFPKSVKIANGKVNYYQMTAKKNEFLVFESNNCFHRAGNPTKKRIRSQIMFQLNPSKNWSYSSDLFNKQKKREPKFPFIYDVFTKKENILIE